MTTRVRALSAVAVLVLATIWLAGCDHYVCKTTFGNASCSSSGSGLGGSGGTGTSSAFVYAVDQGTNGATTGTIDGYALDATAVTFGPISSYTAPTVPLNSGGTGMVVAQDLYLYAAFGATDQVYGWTISSTGNLTAVTGSPFSVPAAGGYILGVGQANMITNPAGTLLFISDAIQTSIAVYSIGSGGVLSSVGLFACPAGFTPMNLTTDGLGKYLYAVDGNYSTHQGTQVAAFSISAAGTLTPVVGSPFVFPMWQLKGEPSGQFLIGTTGTTVAYNGRDDNNLYSFAITQTGANAGALTQVAKQSTVDTPFSIAVQSQTGGALVYSFGFNDSSILNPVEGYSISSSGGLTAVSGSPFSLGEGLWGQFDQSGGLLFSYVTFLNQSTNTETTQISPVSVGSGGLLTQPASTLTIATPGFWAVADTP